MSSRKQAQINAVVVRYQEMQCHIGALRAALAARRAAVGQGQSHLKVDSLNWAICRTYRTSMGLF